MHSDAAAARRRATALIGSALALLLACAGPAPPRRVVRVQTSAAWEPRDIHADTRPSLRQPLPMQVSMRVAVPRDGRLFFAYGIPRRELQRLRKPVRVTMSAVRDREERLLFEDVFDRTPPVRWREATLDLSEFEGLDLELVFAAEVSVDPQRPRAARMLLAAPVVYSAALPLSRPNVLLIGIDTLRADRLGTYGGPNAPAPIIDAVAGRGVVFEQAYSQSSWTLPSFMSIFTGLYPSRHGVVATTNRLSESVLTLPDIFRHNGYLSVGFFDGGYLSPGYGYDRLFDSYRRLGRRARGLPRGEGQSRGLGEVEQVVDWVETHAALPWFVFVHTYDVHDPYDSVPSQYHSRFAADTEGLESTLAAGVPQRRFSIAQQAARLALYDGEISFVDERLESIFAALEARGQLDDTLVIITSDHGEEFGEHGGGYHAVHLHREVVHVPLILAGPGIPLGVRVPEVVETVDLLPTLVELLGLEVPANESVDGRSLVGLFTRGGSSARDGRGLAISELHGQKYAVRSAEWTLLGGPDGLQLFRFGADPWEWQDVEGAESARAAAMSAAYSRMVDGERMPAETARPSRETLEDLRGLGYVE